MRISPTLAASIGLAILAFAAPGKAHADALPDPAMPIAAPDQPEADPPAPPPAPPTLSAGDYERSGARYARRRIAAGVGVRFGSFTVNGDSTGNAIPFHLELGVRQQRLFVFAGYDLFSIAAPVAAAAPDGTARAIAAVGDGSGLVHRLGATARYAIGRLGENDGGLDVWAEGGLGVQHIRWDAGGVWTRPDLAIGLGASVLYLGKKQHAGMTIGLRMLLAPRNDGDGAPVACGGPCDHPTTPSRTDRSFMFEITLPFGL